MALSRLKLVSIVLGNVFNCNIFNVLQCERTLKSNASRIEEM